MVAGRLKGILRTLSGRDKTPTAADPAEASKQASKKRPAAQKPVGARRKKTASKRPRKRNAVPRPAKPSPATNAKQTESATGLPLASLRRLEKKLGYRFRDKELLAQALTHPSFLLHTSEQLSNNQRLEFLGDSVIQLALTEALYHKHPTYREGKLTALRAGYARGEYMANMARELELNLFLRLKPKDREAGLAEQDGSLSDAFEALLGAVYLDSDWETARQLALRLYNHLQDKPVEEGVIANPKGKLQELIQMEHGNEPIVYKTTSQSGAPHDRVFTVAIVFRDETLGEGRGRTKKEASEMAARQAIEAWLQP